ncbi:hypothetical protein CR919_15035 [Stenotrophomonas sp. LMG 10879]|uniref:hypothetical protein n=1 Tax=Stenotrophomonas sp. LMG 10879 TaxID=487706 RepID=UPI000C1A40A8|nr:hypothetical protein [Stenotrophomonas sp. LMG 10879]PII19001.1 hypothetical protein CR919_15035 [Stenotrophomonas sp. LMG 10879]
MTTDKTPATLATVKHGGSVQLPTSERARFDAFLRGNPFMGLMAGTAWQVWQAALSAQPSPGGQNALADAARRVLSDVDSGDYHGEISEATYAALEAALAARQPVGQPAIWVSPGQLAAHKDRVPGDGGAYLPARLTRDGQFTKPLYAAPPAQAVDLAQLPHGIRLIEIPRRNNLDPINVFVQDYELGRGRIVVTCYGQAWCGFWGAMGDRTVMQFVAACAADYVAGNMLSGRHEHVKKHERVYVERIAADVIAEFRALIDSQAVGE